MFRRAITRLPTCVHRGVSRLVWSGQTVRCNVSEASLGLDRHLRGFSRVLMFSWSAATKCWYLSGFLVQRGDLGLWLSRGLMPRRRRFSGSRPTEHRALYRVVRDFTSQGSGQRVRRPDSISSVMLTVAFSQSHCSQCSASVGFPCHRGVTSSVGWVLLPFHTVPPACLPNVGSALGERKRLTLVVSRVHALFR